MKNSNWEFIPLKNAIVAALIKSKGVITDSDLFRNLKSDENFEEISLNDLKKELMTLEIQGILFVSRMTESKNRIELNPDVQKELENVYNYED